MSIIPIDHDPFWRDNWRSPFSSAHHSSTHLPDFMQRSMRDMERGMQDMDRQMRTYMHHATQQSTQQQQQQSHNSSQSQSQLQQPQPLVPFDTNNYHSLFPHSMSDRSNIEPAIVNDVETGQRKAQWSFDCGNFNPEDISITSTGNKLEVKAKHEDRGEHHQHVREFTRVVTLPESVKAPEMRSRLTQNGILTVEAPYREAIENQQYSSQSSTLRGSKAEREIQIRHT